MLWAHKILAFALSSVKTEYKAAWAQLWLSGQCELHISDGLHGNHLAELPGQVNSWKEKWLIGMKYTLLVPISTKAKCTTVRLIHHEGLTIEKPSAPEQLHLNPCFFNFISLIKIYSRAQQLRCLVAQCPLVTVQLKFPLCFPTAAIWTPLFHLQLARVSD